MTSKSTFERPEVLAELNRERAAMMRPARIEYSKLKPPITFSVTRDENTDQETQDFARFSREQLAQHREEQQADARKLGQVRRLAGARGAAIPAQPRNVDRVKQGLDLEIAEAWPEIEAYEKQKALENQP
ncbi:MAG: hypothetical protein MUF81_17820 [Verrucomicrobia bacterium]|nr:hypothetical protein [Verrucomicrobiota bacterium]